jgi:hypothetical protein
MPRPKISVDTMGVINEVVAKYSDFSPSELSTEAKVLFVIRRMNELADRPKVLAPPSGRRY